jgi:hypothetical protein
MLLPKAGHKMTPSQTDGPTQNRQDAVRGIVIEGVDLGGLQTSCRATWNCPSSI